MLITKVIKINLNIKKMILKRIQPGVSKEKNSLLWFVINIYLFYFNYKYFYYHYLYVHDLILSFYYNFHILKDIYTNFFFFTILTFYLCRKFFYTIPWFTVMACLFYCSMNCFHIFMFLSSKWYIKW